MKAAPVEPPAQRGVWASAFGGAGSVDGDAVVGTNKTTSRIYGYAGGYDRRVSPHTTIGFALAGGGTSWSLSDGLGGGSSDFFQAGLYGSHRFWSNAYVSGALAYAWHQTTTSRMIAAIPQTLIADFDAQSFGARIEGGYRFAMRPFSWTPYAAAQVQSFRTPGYTERANPVPFGFPLTFNSQTTTTTRSELGFWGDAPIILPNAALLTLRGRAAWVHDFDNDRRISANFQALPGAPSRWTARGRRRTVRCSPASRNTAPRRTGFCTPSSMASFRARRRSTPGPGRLATLGDRRASRRRPLRFCARRM